MNTVSIITALALLINQWFISPATCASEPKFEFDLYTKTLLYEDDFDNDLSQWTVESQPTTAVSLIDGRLNIDVSSGCTVWFNHRLHGAIMIDYQATMIDADGPHDRVSDMNCFWMAVDPQHPDDIFANSMRQGAFRNYHSLRLYHVGQGGNDNSSTRFRRHPGTGERPLLAEHNLRDKAYMNQPNSTRHITIVAVGSKIQYWCDNQLIFDYIDEDPFTSGWFAFRTVRNHMQINSFKVYQLTRSQATDEQ